MSDDDPMIHVHNVGVFDPVDAWCQTMANLFNLMVAVRNSPDALPASEILTATQLACDTLEAITELTNMSLGGEIASVLPDGAVEAHNAQDEATKAGRTPDEAALWKLSLIQGITNIVPVEEPPSV